MLTWPYRVFKFFVSSNTSILRKKYFFTNCLLCFVLIVPFSYDRHADIQHAISPCLIISNLANYFLSNGVLFYFVLLLAHIWIHLYYDPPRLLLFMVCNTSQLALDLILPPCFQANYIARVNELARSLLFIKWWAESHYLS